MRNDLKSAGKYSLTLSWEDVTAFSSPSLREPEKKKLIKNVCGIAKCGSLTAILSPSGAGKTTLLAALSQRYKGALEGRILLNGHEFTQEQMSNISGFVCQKDPMLENLTVFEHLNFTARLKMDASSTASSRHKRVMRTVENLVLSHRLHISVGSLSGGQKKRLSLAIQGSSSGNGIYVYKILRDGKTMAEWRVRAVFVGIKNRDFEIKMVIHLLTEPKILFCDEPTTGLDSFSAISVVKLLRNIANDGTMVICSIHQPASGIFELFDEVSLLVSSGCLGYHGPVDEVAEYFARLGMICPENYNLSDFIISKITARPPSVSGSKNDEKRIHELVENYKSSKQYYQLVADQSTAIINEEFVDTRKRITHVTFYTELHWLLWRSTVQLSRSYKTWLLRFAAYVFVFSCLAFPYGVIKNDQMGVQNLQGFLHCLLLEILYSSLYGVCHALPEDMASFIQESADNVYSPKSFYISKIIVLSTKATVETYIYTNYALAVTGLNRTFRDFMVTGVPVILISLVSSAYGFFLSTTFESVTTFSLFSIPFELICQAYGGLILKLSSLPVYTAWLKYVSIVFYAYEALTIDLWMKRPHITCNRPNPHDCAYHTGYDVLAFFGFHKSDILLDYVGLISYFLVLHSLSFFFLLRKLKRSTAY